MNVKVCFLDRHILCIDKPARFLCQGDETGDPSLDVIVKDWYRQYMNKPGNAYVALLHRLDRPVSGCLLFSLTSKASTRMHEMFLRGEIEKEYIAIISRSLNASKLKPKGIVKTPEFKNELEYQILKEVKDKHSENHIVLQLRLRGAGAKKHQIRAMLSSTIGSILGDDRYGNRFFDFKPKKTIALHASKVCFLHPVFKTRIEINSTLPDSWDNVYKDNWLL